MGLPGVMREKMFSRVSVAGREKLEFIWVRGQNIEKNQPGQIFIFDRLWA